MGLGGLSEPTRRVTVRVSERHYQAIQQAGQTGKFTFSALVESLVQFMGEAWETSGSRTTEEWARELFPYTTNPDERMMSEVARGMWSVVVNRAKEIDKVRRKAGGRPKGKTARAVEAALRAESEGEYPTLT